jgi:hypothetical protein
MSVKYEYSLALDFPNNSVNINTLILEITRSAIVTGLDHITVDEGHADIVFKEALAPADVTILDGIVAAHTGAITSEVDAPRMADGRPIVRADTRPLGTQTYFTTAGDDIANQILGAGNEMVWDFTNDDDLYDPNEFENPRPVVSGMKAKFIDLYFIHNVYMKDGAVYFFDAPWGAYCEMYIMVPSGTYYPHPDGPIPAAALGLSGEGKYAYSTKRVFYATYVQKHHMYGDCPMGDEFNAEGAATDPIPPGWSISALVACPENSLTLKGYGSFEVYRTTIGLL